MPEESIISGCYDKSENLKVLGTTLLLITPLDTNFQKKPGIGKKTFENFINLIKQYYKYGQKQ